MLRCIDACAVYLLVSNLALMIFEYCFGLEELYT